MNTIEPLLRDTDFPDHTAPCVVCGTSVRCASFHDHEPEPLVHFCEQHTGWQQCEYCGNYHGHDPAIARRFQK